MGIQHVIDIRYAFRLIATALASDGTCADITAEEGTAYTYRPRAAEDGLVEGYSHSSATAAATTGPSDSGRAYGSEPIN